MKTILLYFGDETKKQPVVEQVLKQLHVHYRIVQDEDLGQSVGTLLNLHGFAPHETSSPMHASIDLMLFEEASDEEIMQLNAQLKEAGVEMKRKAMLTKHNQSWVFYDLLKEIEKEHMYFWYMDKLRALLIQSSELVIEDYTPSSWKIYEQAFYRAYSCMGKECSLEEIKAVYEAFSQAKQQLKKRGIPFAQ